MTTALDSVASADGSRILKLLQEARQQLEWERHRRSEPIAIVGIGCRFPGGVSSPSEFWQLLRDGVDATSDVPRERWDAEALYDPDPDEPGKLYVKRGSFLRDIGSFEPEFFGISPREALGMDPQQRLLLEVTWEALEDAGIPPSRLRGTTTGVWVGFCLDDYARRSINSADATRIDAYSALGNTRSIAVGRIAYVLDLRGPAIQIDTACSSSLVAVHQACHALRSGECDLALVGGVNLMSSPEATIALCKMRALAKDGRCKTFDASADGYGRGDGCGIIVLQRLSDAEAAGHRSHAIIRGSAINQDGHSNGLTAPNGLAQEAVIQAALINAGVEAQNVGYVEAHGTGTQLGDPIEMLALNRVYGASRSTPLYVGAVKTNFGHLEGAAGVAGLIKAALCLSNRQIPPTIHLQELNPRIPWAHLSVRIATACLQWPRNGGAQLAGVSSFGISGTNAHVILEEAPSVEPVPPAPTRSAELVLLSAKTPEALNAVAQRLQDHLQAHPDFALADVAFSLLTTRSLLDHRLAISVPSRSALLDALRLAAQGQTPASAHRAEGLPARGKTAWLFTGQGAQLLGMGQQLHSEWPIFRDALDLVCSLFDPLLDLPLRQVMWADPQSPHASLLDQTGFTQPALFALEWALASLWRSFGIEPDLLLGHSIGEITAAAVAGVFSLEDAVRLVAARARLMQALPTGGAMCSIAASEAVVLDAIRPFPHSVSLAAVNGPSSLVISGTDAHVAAVAETFAARGVQTKHLSVSHAFHSPLMEPMLLAFQKIAEAIEYHSPSIPLVSNLSGALADSSLSTPNYWVRQVRDSVRFAPGVQTLARLGVDTFLELGPRPTLLGLVPACLPPTAEPLALLSSLRPSRPEPEALLLALGTWVARGGNLDPNALFPSKGRRLPLPNYPWQRQRFWIDPPVISDRAVDLDIAALLRRLSERGQLSGAARSALPDILGALANERASSERARLLSSWFYELVWRPIAPAIQSGTTGAWAILGDPAGTESLAAALRRAGGTPHFASIEQLPALLKKPEGLRGVIHLSNGEEHRADRMLAIERSIADAGPSAPRAWWITRGAVGTSLEDAPTHPVQAILWGLGRTLSMEHPRTWGGLIDISPEAISDSTADRIVALLAAAHGEDQFALRRNETFAPRLVSYTPSGTRPLAISGRGTALITGGLGALGLHVARWLAQRGVGQLLLVGRKGLVAGTAAAAAIAEIEALGTSVTVAAADITNREAMAMVLGRLAPDAPLSSVFHAAGVSDITPFEELTADHLQEVLSAKFEGTAVLDDLTRSLPLEAFVCFSSIAGVWGAGRQAAYSAANAFLDAWAHAARAVGRPVFSVSWGPWSGGGMADETKRSQLARRGLRALAPQLALHALERVLSSAPGHATVVDVDWPAFRRSFEAWGPRALLDEIERAGQPEHPQRGASHPIAESLAHLSEADRAKHLQAWITTECSAILGHSGSARLDPVRGFFDLGMDSLMVVELRNRLEAGLGRDVSPSVMFSYPSISSLADYLVQSAASKAVPSTDADLAERNPKDEEQTRERLSDSSTDEDVIDFINSRFESD